MNVSIWAPLHAVQARTPDGNWKVALAVNACGQIMPAMFFKRSDAWAFATGLREAGLTARTKPVLQIGVEE